jgi:hypothetical protein
VVKYLIKEYVVLNHFFDYSTAIITNVASEYYTVLTNNNTIEYVLKSDITRYATKKEIKQFNDDFIENFYRKHYEKGEKR